MHVMDRKMDGQAETKGWVGRYTDSLIIRKRKSQGGLLTQCCPLTENLPTSAPDNF